MTVDQLVSMLAALAPAVGVYAAVRADLASQRVRLDRAEKDIQILFTLKGHHEQKTPHSAA